MENKYNYAFIDLSYILSRNLYIISLAKKPGEYNESNLVKSTIQSVSKLVRDYKNLITTDKIIFIGDGWSEKYSGYYRTFLVKNFSEYKGDRDSLTQAQYETLVSSGTLSNEELEKARSIAYMTEVKIKAKTIIAENLRYFGIPTLFIEGWEADDISWLLSNLLYTESDRKNLLITRDSDWKYNLSPKMDYFAVPGKNETPKIITYDEMYNSIPQELRDLNLSLYSYHCMTDALGYGHNSLGICKKPRANSTKTLLKILNNDFSNVIDKEMYEAQLDTFDISKFPNFEKAKKYILEEFPRIGRLGTVEEFHNFCQKFNIHGISDEYYKEFISNLNPNYYKE